MFSLKKLKYFIFSQSQKLFAFNLSLSLLSHLTNVLELCCCWGFYLIYIKKTSALSNYLKAQIQSRLFWCFDSYFVCWFERGGWWRIFLTECFRKHIGSNKSCSGSFPLQTSASSPLLINRLSQSYSNQEDFNLGQNEKEPEKTFLFPFILLMNFSDISLCFNQWQN